MNIGFATNAWGVVLADSNATTNVNEAFYISTGSDEEAIQKIGKAGFRYIEMLDGNLLQYENREEELRQLLKASNTELLTVYCAANFIYDEILEEELYKIERALKIAKKFGAKFLVAGGGARRSNGICEGDYKKLGKALDKVVDLAKKYEISAGYHPHIGALVLTEGEIDKLMASTKMELIPDFGHICSGGGNPVAIVEKYAERISYVHLVDHDGADFRLFGEGAIDFNEIKQLLDANGKEVVYTIEAAYQADDYFDGNHDLMLQTAAKHVKEFFHE
ncbi:MAG: sugar phosphate isomerase/epimerase [Hespellia sp.]|nr:sugar phosphate isomerase/epimerase [Hespellia sp.]